MFRYFDEGMPLEPLHENAAHGATSDAVETPSDAVEMPLNTLEMPLNTLEMPLAAPRLSVRRVLHSKWGRALLAAALVLLLGLVPLLHHEEKPVTQPVIAEHRRQPVVKPFVAQRQMPAEQPSSADKTSLVQPSAVVVKTIRACGPVVRRHMGLRVSGAPRQWRRPMPTATASMSKNR